MVINDEKIALLALQKTPFLGDSTIKKMISIFGSAVNVLDQKKATLLKIEGIGEGKLRAFGEQQWIDFAKAELDRLCTYNITMTTYLDTAYPKRLAQCVDGPVILFSRGVIDWDNPRIISIVGTRKITSYGLGFINDFISDIAVLNPLVISGFAYGVDIAAHRACIAHGIQNVGVLAHGLNQMYPKAHTKYVSQVETHGGFVSDFTTQDRFLHTNFLQRNRIIAGLSEATLVIESAAKGGSLVTADFANGYHRELFAVPGRVSDKQSIGCNNLIKQHKAHVLTSAADLVYILGWDMKPKNKKGIQKQLFVTLSDEEQSVFNYLEIQGKTQLDSIAIACSMPTYKIASILIGLEMKGLVKALPGKNFEVC